MSGRSFAGRRIAVCGRALAAPWRAMLATVVLSLSLIPLVAPLSAQSSHTPSRGGASTPGPRAPRVVSPPVSSPESSLLDAWIVTRYRGAELLPDIVPSVPPQPGVTGAAVPPRVEAVRTGDGAVGRSSAVDTLIAVHFAPRHSAPSLAPDAAVQLAGPSGTIIPLATRLVARRAFRAPRLPGHAVERPDSSWRYGWAYLATIPRTPGRSAARYSGWMLLVRP